MIAGIFAGLAMAGLLGLPLIAMIDGGTSNDKIPLWRGVAYGLTHLAGWIALGLLLGVTAHP